MRIYTFMIVSICFQTLLSIPRTAQQMIITSMYPIFRVDVFAPDVCWASLLLEIRPKKTPTVARHHYVTTTYVTLTYVRHFIRAL